MTEETQDSEVLSDQNLDDVFKSEVEDVVEKPEPKPELKGDIPDEEAEPPSEEDDVEITEKKSVPFAALKSERQARQAAQAELDALKAKYAPENEEQSDTDIGTLLFAERTNMSREVMIDLKPDYEEMEAIFTEIAKENPHLTQAMMKSPNPAKYAYTKAKEHIELEELKSLKTSSDWESFQKWKAEQAKKPVEVTPDVKRKQSVLSAPNLNRVTSVASNSTPQEKVGGLDSLFDD